MSEAFGQHLVVDAAGCNDRIGDRDAIAAFADDLVKAVDMKAYGAPWIEHFGHGLPKTSGFTLVQLIETSNLSAHFCDHSGEAYFDIFSCKDFDENIALEVIAQHFEPEVCETRSLIRQAPRSGADPRARVASRGRVAPRSGADIRSEADGRPKSNARSGRDDGPDADKLAS